MIEALLEKYKAKFQRSRNDVADEVLYGIKEDLELCAKYKPFLVYWVGDGGDSESDSVHYACLVHAQNEKEAKDVYMKSEKNTWSNKDPENYGVMEMKGKQLITIKFK